MTSRKLRAILEDRLRNENYRMSYNRDKDRFRVEWKDTKQGINVTLPSVIAKYNERGERAIDELVAHLEEALKIMKQEVRLHGVEQHIYPVIRSTSFPTKTNDGTPLITKEHTAETRIFFALDLGKSYRLIDATLLEQENWTEERLIETAMFNMRSLAISYKEDEVQSNRFYFVAPSDGYAASRMLNESFLQEMKRKATGDLAVAVPHQDVLIVADIVNNTGYDVLAQITMKFFAEGNIPITSLSFIYDEGELEPIFILAKSRRIDKRDDRK